MMSKSLASEKINAEGNRRMMKWYRSKLDRDLHRELNQRSDLKGFAQTTGHLGLLVITGSLAIYGLGHWPWYVVALIIFTHGTFQAFLINGFHELCHNTVFKTKALNRFSLKVFSFFGWYNYVFFTASHTKHHQYTLHPPDDLEVVLPQFMTLKNYLKTTFIRPRGLYDCVRSQWQYARGNLTNEWARDVLFPDSAEEKRRELSDWARFLLIGHGVILVVSLTMGWWILPILTSCSPMYGKWLMVSCNSTQHIGLKDNVPDFRICCRTILLNPFLQFLYWHMNYHIEHHMYAAVPCYNLGKLHRIIRHELPHCPKGVLATWRQIAAIQKKQKTDPSYQFVPELPEQTIAR